MTDIAKSAAGKGLRASAWLFYCAIVFEILFMVSPFALYYYSVYAVPLSWLQRSELTSWLTLHILPHFTMTDCVLSHVLLLLAWPLIGMGLAMFLLGFVQIYWAMLRRSGEVVGGLYRYIRHPQYVALAIVGLGCSIYWSRFIVLIVYVTMLFLYYFLATYEESLCLAKFGESYRKYQTRTGMFLPRAWLEWMPKLASLPNSIGMRTAAIAILYLALVGATIGFGWGLKRHVVARLTVSSVNDTLLVALAPSSSEALTRVQSILRDDPAYRAKRDRYFSTVAPQALGYVAPSTWSVPELGLVNQRDQRHSLSEIFYPTIHGNSLDFDANRLTVLLTQPVLIDPNARGRDALLGTLGYVPKLKVELDMEEGRVLRVSDEPHASQWKGIPVPVY